MNRFNSLLLISAHFLALSCALPQGYGPTNTGGCQGNSCNQRVPSSKVPAGCRIDYRNIYDVEQVEYFDKECTEKYKNVCEDKFQRICNPYEEEVCSTKYEKKCEQLTKRQCYTDYRDVPYEDEECNDNYVRECPQIWEEDGNAKVWVPDTTKCVGLYKTSCKLVSKSKKEEYQRCENEPYTECNDYPYQDCKYVTKERCQNQKTKECKDVPYQHCEDVHGRRPQQVTRRKPFLVCDDGTNKALTNQEMTNFGLEVEVIEKDATRFDSDDPNDDVEEFEDELELAPQVKSDSAINFGR